MTRRPAFLSGIFLSLLFACVAHASSVLTPDPLSLDFGNQAEGTLSAAQPLTLTNNSGADQIIGDIFIAGQDPQQFQIGDDLCSGLTLSDGASCSVGILFFPDAKFPGGTGAASASLQIPIESAPVLSVALTGTSLVSQISVNPMSLDFGTVVAGRLSDPQTLTITNIGASDLSIEDNKVIGSAPADFGVTMDFCSFQTLAPGESCQIAISMRATELGDRTAQFVIENNDPSQRFLILDLSGAGKGSGGCQLSSSPFSWKMDFLSWFLPVASFGFLILLRSRRPNPRP